MNAPILVQKAHEEVAEMKANGASTRLDLEPGSAFYLVGLVQLALRHEGVPPGARMFGLDLITGLAKRFADKPHCMALIRLGGLPKILRKEGK